MQPRRSAPEERDTVTVARDPGPGNGHSILSARDEPQISSDNLTYINLHIISLASTFATIFL